MTEVISSDRLLDRSEVEARFGIPKRFLEVAAVRGDGPPMVKIGRLARYRIKDLQEWIETQRVVGDSCTAR